MPRDGAFSIKDKIEGNECDLSLSDLTTVPIKELVAVPKVTQLDLSCNILTSLPDEFCQLTHLVRLDLSKNALTRLPDKFGALSRLQHLDLFSNKLTTLPLSFYRLKNLKWLDVKDNQLSDQLKKIAGDCLDDSQCKQCAKNVISFMKEADAENQRQIQRRVLEKKEREAALKAETERINKEKREQKRLEKERKRKEYEESIALKESNTETKEEDSDVIQPSQEMESKVIPVRSKGGIGCFKILLAVLIGIAAVFLGFYFYCQQNADEEVCRRAAFQVMKYKYYLQKYYEKYSPWDH